VGRPGSDFAASVVVVNTDGLTIKCMSEGHAAALMSVQCHTRPFDNVDGTAASPQRTDMFGSHRLVGVVPQADVWALELRTPKQTGIIWITTKPARRSRCEPGKLRPASCGAEMLQNEDFGDQA
jgi:hypothetical protein